MIGSNRAKVAGLWLCAAFGLMPLPALAAFSCPAPSAPLGGDALDFSAAAMSGGHPGLSRELLDRADRMRRHGLANGAIVDRLVEAYCAHVAAEPNASDGEKSDQVRRFAADVASTLYNTAPGNEQDIVLDVPVPADLYRKLHLAAEKAKLTQDAWVTEAIRSHLASP